MTITGEYLTLEGGAPSLEAMARGLSRMPRFAGQTLPDWNVDDHLVVAEQMARHLFPGWPEILFLHVLLHDAHEVYTGDIPTSFKLPVMKTLQEEVLDRRIYDSLGLKLPENGTKNIIKVIDEEALLAEAAHVVPKMTYDKIVEERGHHANRNLVNIVVAYQETPMLSRVPWHARVTTLLERVERA